VPNAGPEALLDAGDPFARDLLEVLQLICPAPSLVNGELPPGDRAILRPNDGSTAEPGIMRTTTSGIDLRFFYKYDVDPEGGYLRIQTSSIGLSPAGASSELSTTVGRGQTAQTPTSTSTPTERSGERS